MIPRKIKKELLEQLNEYPIVTVIGPRQTGKTTLVQSALPDYAYRFWKPLLSYLN